MLHAAAAARTQPAINRPAFQPNTAPAGYVEFASSVSALRSSRGRGRVAIVIFWLSTIAFGLAALAAWSRRAKVHDFLDGQATLDDVDKADGLVVAASITQGITLVLGGVAVAIWARRVAKNAVARRAFNVSVGRATFGWFVPVGNWWMGFSSVRAAVTQLGGSGQSVGAWQGAFLFANLATWLASLGTRSLDVAQSTSDINNTLNRLLVTSLIAFVLLFLTALLAMRAMRDVNRVVCDPPPGYDSQAGRVAS